MEVVEAAGLDTFGVLTRDPELDTEELGDPSAELLQSDRVTFLGVPLLYHAYGGRS